MKGCEHLNDLLKGRTFLVEGLGLVRVVPDIGIGKGQLNFGQAVFLVRQVKGTPSAQRHAH